MRGLPEKSTVSFVVTHVCFTSTLFDVVRMARKTGTMKGGHAHMRSSFLQDSPKRYCLSQYKP